MELYGPIISKLVRFLISVIDTFVRVASGLSIKHRQCRSGHFSAVVLGVIAGSGTDECGGALLVESASTRRLLSARDIRCDGKASNGRSPAPILGRIVSLGPNCSACGEGSICRTSGGRGSSLPGGPISRSDILLARSRLGDIAIEDLLS